MKPSKNIFILLIICSVLLPLSAADNITEITVIDEVDRLIAEKQYQSAWTLLHDKAAEIEISDMILKKTELTLLYYAKTNLHQMFAFTDLDQKEELSDIRKKEGNFDFKLFDPAGAVSMVISENPDSAEAYFWLGEYYHQVMTLYGDEWEKPLEEIRSLIIANFKMAAALGMETEEIYSKLSYIELLTGNWKEAVADLNKALEFNSGNPAYYHDLSIANLNMNQFADALSYAEKAITLYEDPYYKADSAFLASTIALHMGNNGKAEAFLLRGSSLSPDDYRFPDRLIRLYLSLEEYEKARTSSADLFALYPDNPANCITIIQYFYSAGKLDETADFFEQQIKKYDGESGILGNLYFHKALAEGYQGLNTKALESYALAETEFKQVYPPENQVFNVIENRIAELKAED